MGGTVSIDMFPKGGPGYAMQLRLTPEILAAIQGGAKASIRFTSDHKQAVVTVGGNECPFKALPQEGCKLLAMHEGKPSQCIANIPMKLHPARVLPDRLPPGAAAILKPLPAAPFPKIITRVAVKPAQIPSKPPKQPDPPSNTPSDGPKSSREHTAASTSRGTSTSTLRRAIVWVLAQRPAGLVKKSIKTRLASTAVPGGPISFQNNEIERIIKDVAIYKPPGMYVLKPELAGEADNWSLEAKRARIDLSGGNGNTTTIDRQCDTPTAPSVGGQKSDDGYASVGTKRPLSRPLSAGSRGSDDADESWVLEHTGRQPLAPPPIQSPEEHDACEAEFRRKYEFYFRLRQLIAANRKDFEALTLALDAATTDADKERLENEVRGLWERRSRRARQWKAAFDVLHQELTAMKARLAEYSDTYDEEDSEPYSPPGVSDSE